MRPHSQKVQSTNKIEKLILIIDKITISKMIANDKLEFK